MSNPDFVYVTYIETTAEQLWQALTSPDFTERYWFGFRVASDWKTGSSYAFTKPGAPQIEGTVLQSDPPHRLAYSWSSCSPDDKQEGPSRVTFDLAPQGDVVKLTVTHDGFKPGSQVLPKISGGWPVVLSNLKSLLEAGHALMLTPPGAPAKESADA
jgi:uncharacterized protein YndB with AHSA1/START domain